MIIEINQTIAAVGIFVKPTLIRVKILTLARLGLEKLRNGILNNVLLFHKKDVPVQSRTRE